MIESSDLSHIVEILKSSSLKVLAVDGFPGAGKSTLANFIAEKLNWQHINLDDYIEKHQGQYINSMQNYKIIDLINTQKVPVIIEGLCLLQILQINNIDYDFLIYVKKISLSGNWIDKDEYFSSGDVEKFVTKKRKDYEKISKIGAMFDRDASSDEYVFNDVIEEVIRYNDKYSPHMVANIIYSRIDVSPHDLASQGITT
jgi:hypothetical protein